MHNEVEFLIEQILARKEEVSFGWPGRDLNCPDVTLLMARALDQAPPDKVREVDEHCAHCDGCRTLLHEYRTWFRDEPPPDPPIEGSLLEIIADPRPFAPKRPPFPWGDRPAPSSEDNAPTRTGGDTSVTPTDLAQQPTRWPVLLAWLATWLPDLLQVTNLPEQSTGDFRSWVTERLPNLGVQRLSEALATWLAAFAEARGMSDRFTPLTPALIRALVAARSVEDVLRQQTPGEPEWASAFREWALSQRPASARALLALEPQGRPPDENLRAFRRALYQKAEQCYQEYQEKLQLVG